MNGTHPLALLCRLADTGLSGVPDPTLAAALTSPRAPWRAIIPISGVHLLTPALSACLDRLGIAAGLDEELRLYLAEMSDAGAERNAWLREDLLEIGRVLNRAGIVPTALKGAIRLVDGLFPDPFWRFMHDLDLLLPREAMAEAYRILAGEGWRDGGPNEDGRGGRHLTLVHPRAEARLELHATALELPLDGLLPAPRLLVRAGPIEIEGVTLALPALDDQLVHLVAHGMLQHAFQSTGRFLLRDLIELTLLIDRGGPDVAWEAEHRLARAGHAHAWPLSRWLAAACLPQAHGAAPPTTSVVALLGRRMLLQQRSPWAMRLLAPVGWGVARLAERAPRQPKATLAERLVRLMAQHATFRRKTRW